jgi:hypothetical protein
MVHGAFRLQRFFQTASHSFVAVSSFLRALPCGLPAHLYVYDSKTAKRFSWKLKQENFTSNKLFGSFIVTEVRVSQTALEGSLLCLLKCNAVTCNIWVMCNVHNTATIHTHIHTCIYTLCIWIFDMSYTQFSFRVCNRRFRSKWTERVRNEEVLHTVKEEKNIL